VEYSNFSKLSREALLECFEQERKEWLAAGMSEADIHLIHFGEEKEKGRGGDYRVWLNERKHRRPDHKYAPGTPAAIDAVDPNGAWISGGRGGLDEVEFQADLEVALATLTELQRFCFVEVYLNDRAYTDVAKHCGKHHSTIQESVKAASAKIKNYFS
jgi:hypothetical protein